MTFTDEKIYPDESGSLFGTNAENSDQLIQIQKALADLEYVKKVTIHDEEFPYKITVVVNRVTQVDAIQKQAIKAGYHVIPHHSLDF